MKPFDLEAAKAGAPIITRSGKEAKFLAHVPEANEECRVVWCTVDGNVVTSDEHGNWVHRGDKHSLDLFMKPQKRTVFINVWKSSNGKIGCSSHPFDSEMECREWAPSENRSYLARGLAIEIEE